ncbi:MAG: FAD:protein FMN transferase [Bacteroidales bacterium]|nr:FAD:protein FMN transferase [Candidatus Cryptobacteroides onthequi]
MENTFEFLNDGTTFHGVIPHIMGTRIEMLVTDTCADNVSPLWDWLCIEAEHLGTILNRFDPGSETTALNCAQEPIHVSNTLAEMIRISLQYSIRTLGLFDISKGHYKEIEVSLDNKVSTHGHPLDFGGIAKGYLLSRLGEKCKSRSVRNAFINFGSSSILCIGHHPYGNCWKVGVQDPFGHGILMDIELRDQSMSTSGNTSKHGLHIIDPATGRPNNERKAITVIADDPLDAEVVSTALMLADEEQKTRILANFPDITEKTFHIR